MTTPDRPTALQMLRFVANQAGYGNPYRYEERMTYEHLETGAELSLQAVVYVGGQQYGANRRVSADELAQARVSDPLEAQWALLRLTVIDTLQQRELEQR